MVLDPGRMARSEVEVGGGGGGTVYTDGGGRTVAIPVINEPADSEADTTSAPGTEDEGRTGMSDLDRGDLIQQEVNPEVFNRLYEEAIRGSSSGSDGELSGIANRHRAGANSLRAAVETQTAPTAHRGSLTADILGLAVANALQETEKENNEGPEEQNGNERPGRSTSNETGGQTDRIQNNHTWGGLGQDREVELKSESESDLEQVAAGPGFLTDWPGDFRFKLKLPSSGKARDPQYSSYLNKLYIAQNRAVTLTLSTSAPATVPLSLRAQLVFTSPDHQKDPVRVCYQHSHTGGGTPRTEALASHVLRLTAGEPHVDVKYLHFTDTGKHAVLVSPLPPPAPGTCTVPITIRFTDLSSCPGGINRREIAVVFTLESKGRVVGRKVLPVRVCTCPKRDRQHDEKERGGSSSSSSGRVPGGKRAPPETLVQSESQGGDLAGGQVQPSTSGVAEEFWVLAKGVENYKALKQMAEVLEKHRGGDMAEWERKQEDGKKRRRI